MKPETYGALSLAFKNLHQSRSSSKYRVKKMTKAQKHITRAQKYENIEFDILKRWNQSFWVKLKLRDYLPLKGTIMNPQQIEQIAIDYPDDAESRLLESTRPDQKDIEYLRFILSKLQGKENRTVDSSWRESFFGSSMESSINIEETADKMIGSARSEVPPKDEPVHDWNQEQGNRENANPSEESTQ